MNEITKAREAIDNLDYKVKKIEEDFEKIATYDRIKEELIMALDTDKVFNPYTMEHEDIQGANLYLINTAYIQKVSQESSDSAYQNYMTAYLGMIQK